MMRSKTHFMLPTFLPGKPILPCSPFSPCKKTTTKTKQKVPVKYTVIRLNKSLNLVTMNSYKSCVTCGPRSPWEPLFPCSPLLPWKKNQALCIRKHVAYTALFFGMKLTLLQSIYLFGDCWNGWTGRSWWALRTSLTRLPCFTFESNALISLRKTEDKISVTRDSNRKVFLNSRLSEIFWGNRGGLF